MNVEKGGGAGVTEEAEVKWGVWVVEVIGSGRCVGWRSDVGPSSSASGFDEWAIEFDSTVDVALGKPVGSGRESTLVLEGGSTSCAAAYLWHRRAGMSEERMPAGKGRRTCT